MSTVGFIRSSLKQMHTTYNDATRDLSPEHMSWQNDHSSISRVLGKDSAATDPLTIANERSIMNTRTCRISACWNFSARKSHPQETLAV